MHLNDFKACIQVDDVSLVEYHTDVTEEAEERAGSCFIASTSGKAFSITLTNDSEYLVLCRVYLDGIKAEKYIVRKNSTATLGGIAADSQKVRPFAFSSLKMTDDDSAPLPQLDLSRLGTIEIYCYRAESKSEYAVDRIRKQRRLATFDDLTAVPEKMKKGGSHRVRLGQAETAKDVKFVSVWHDSHPYLSFTFTYRPEDMLKAQGIISSEAQEEGNNSRKRNRDDFEGSQNECGRNDDPELQEEVEAEEVDDELEQLLAERAALDAEIREVEALCVKRESSPIVLGAFRGTLIDLTRD